MADYDVVIIGGGQAGIPLAYALANAGKRVALAERKDLGGSCVNFGCTPTKAAIASSSLAHQARRAAEFGLRIPTVEVDFPAVLKRAREVAGESRAGLDKGFANSTNPRLLRAHARFQGRVGDGFELRIGEETVTAAEVVINTGTRSLIPEVGGIHGIDYLHSGNWLHGTELPGKLAMLGGGYIAMEMAQFYRRMGSEVDVYEKSERILGHEDPDISEALEKMLEAEGIRFHLNTTVRDVKDLEFSHLFVA